MPARKREGTAQVMYGHAGGTVIVEDVQDGWHVQAWVELRDGAPRITDLRVRPAGGTTLRAAHQGAGPRAEYPHQDGRKMPAGGITADVLRAISLTSIHAALRDDDATAMTYTALGVDTERLSPGRPGRRGREDGFYAVWAQRYVEECKTTRSPYAALSARWSYSERTIRDFVDKARKRGLLVGRSMGRAGGRLSAKAERMLATKGEDQ